MNIIKLKHQKSSKLTTAPKMVAPIHTWKVSGSNLRSDIDYSEVLHGYSQFLQVNASLGPQIRPQPLPSTSF
jgi:hypothetical protein